jgi:CelD/BcsL family acetyltransferase involved in cellulose biosynthesis
MIEALQAEPRIAVDDSDRAGDGSATADLIRSPREFAGLAEEWRELFASSGCDNDFLSYEWMSAWWEQWGGAVSLFIVAIREPAGRLVAIAPFCVRASGRFPFSRRILGFLSFSKACCDHLDILVDPGFEAAAARSIAGVLMASRRDWTYFEFADADADSPRLIELRRVLKLSGLTELAAPASLCPFIQLPGSNLEFLASLSRSMRGNLRGYARRLEGSGPVEMRCVTAAEAIEDAFTDLVRLHGLRFKGLSHSSSFLDADLQALHKRILVPMARAGRVRIYQLRVNGCTVAALYGFTAGRRFFHYQAGMDPAWLRDGVGAACIAGVIEHCISTGAVEYDFLRGNEEYKTYWTRTARQDCTYRLFDGRLASRMELAHLRLMDAARVIKRRIESLRGSTRSGTEQPVLHLREHANVGMPN